MQLKKLDELLEYLKQRPKKRLVVAYGQDAYTLDAVNEAVSIGITDATIVGDEKIIIKVCKERGIDYTKFEIFNESDEAKAGYLAVALINQGKGDVLMKGLISTDKYMRAILDKEKGLLPPKAVLSHIAVFECPTYHKLIIASDVAVIPSPDLNQKIAITRYLIEAAHALGIEKPKLAIISAAEKVNPKMSSCSDAAIISKMADRGQIKGAFVDGPLSLDVALDQESTQIKGVISEVAGDADCLLFPNIECANVFYKTMTKLAKAELGAYVVGAKVPAILPSRGDNAKSKLYSIALSCALC